MKSHYRVYNQLGRNVEFIDAKTNEEAVRIYSERHGHCLCFAQSCGTFLDEDDIAKENNEEFNRLFSDN